MSNIPAAFSTSTDRKQFLAALRLWTILLSLAAVAFALPASAGELRLLKAKTNDEGILITEGDAKVLFYQRKSKSLDGKYERANYVHPLYDLDGNVLTEDFPPDHFHHRGIFWAWHQVRIGDKKLGDPWLTEDFSWDVVGADVEQADDDAIDLKLRVFWKSPLWFDEQGQPKPLVDERTTIRVFAAVNKTRKIDFEIQLRAVERDLCIGGSEDEKGYGGFSARFRLPEDIRFVGELGEVEPQTTGVDCGRWMDMAASFGKDDSTSGMAILCHPTTAGFPQRWILRKSESMQNAVFPGRQAVPLPHDAATIFRYRLVLHREDADAAEVQKWQKEYEAYYRRQ